MIKEKRSNINGLAGAWASGEIWLDREPYRSHTTYMVVGNAPVMNQRDTEMIQTQELQGEFVQIVSTTNPFAEGHIGECGEVRGETPDGTMVIVILEDGSNYWALPHNLSVLACSGGDDNSSEERFCRNAYDR